MILRSLVCLSPFLLPLSWLGANVPLTVLILPQGGDALSKASEASRSGLEGAGAGGQEDHERAAAPSPQGTADREAASS